MQVNNIIFVENFWHKREELETSKYDFCDFFFTHMHIFFK